MKIKTLHIFDVDGTLVNSEHRYRINQDGKINLDYWIANENKTMEDKPLPLFDFAKNLPPGHAGIIATARVWCDLSKQFAAKHGLKLPVIARKNRQDNRGGASLKITGIKRLLNLKQYRDVEEIHVYEDNFSYLKALMIEFKAIGHYCPSNQGH